LLGPTKTTAKKTKIKPSLAGPSKNCSFRYKGRKHEEKKFILTIVGLTELKKLKSDYAGTKQNLNVVRPNNHSKEILIRTKCRKIQTYSVTKLSTKETRGNNKRK
jgi:hypothetical protein